MSLVKEAVYKFYKISDAGRERWSPTGEGTEGRNVRLQTEGTERSKPAKKPTRAPSASGGGEGGGGDQQQKLQALVSKAKEMRRESAARKAATRVTSPASN